MDVDRPMYVWRGMTSEERRIALEERKKLGHPWHGPAHYEHEAGSYLITAACFEHKPFIGVDAGRMATFERKLCETVLDSCQQLFAWTILPNHYHLLAHAPRLKPFLAALGKLHGRISYRWNLEEIRRGRRVWHRSAETAMKSDNHFWTTLNHVLNNAVKHGYVDRWQDWPFCNAEQYLGDVGRETAERRWLEFPVLDFGKDWDPPEL
jgi:putative transposase